MSTESTYQDGEGMTTTTSTVAAWPAELKELLSRGHAGVWRSPAQQSEPAEQIAP